MYGQKNVRTARVSASLNTRSESAKSGTLMAIEPMLCSLILARFAGSKMLPHSVSERCSADGGRTLPQDSASWRTHEARPWRWVSRSQRETLRLPARAAATRPRASALHRSDPPDQLDRQLAPFANAYSVLTDAEMRRGGRHPPSGHDRGPRPGARRRATLVFELVFEVIARHKSASRCAHAQVAGGQAGGGGG